MKDYFEYSDDDEYTLDPLDFDSIDTRLDIEMGIRKLPEREREILQLWVDGYSQEEIGEMLEVTQPRICQILKEIFIKLRT